MRTSGKIPGTGFLFLALTAFALSGCVAAGVATVAAGGSLGLALGQEEPEETASAAPARGNDTTAAPASAGAPGISEPWRQPAAASEPLDLGEPAVLVEPQAPVEEVVVQPIE